jgi:hypothetical protein
VKNQFSRNVIRRNVGKLQRRYSQKGRIKMRILPDKPPVIPVTSIEKSLAQLAFGVELIANSITPMQAAPGHDETGGTVMSLTEAVMGITAALMRVAESNESIAEAIRETGGKKL